MKGITFEKILESTAKTTQTMPKRINRTGIEEGPDQLQLMKMPHLEVVGKRGLVAKDRGIGMYTGSGESANWQLE
ncbi:hypothetical protein LWI29_017356 [Acer saccharum]|uniref:Uncharacterized protein n=1 Tax=Acer saccharum TaxID=4024 RepID=A0AA39RHI0_ACESA|nr:hypothetical protein LWI29_017356 [Acer saccharum]